MWSDLGSINQWYCQHPFVCGCATVMSPCPSGSRVVPAENTISNPGLPNACIGPQNKSTVFEFTLPNWLKGLQSITWNLLCLLSILNGDIQHYNNNCAPSDSSPTPMGCPEFSGITLTMRPLVIPLDHWQWFLMNQWTCALWSSSARFLTPITITDTLYVGSLVVRGSGYDSLTGLFLSLTGIDMPCWIFSPSLC